MWIFVLCQGSFRPWGVLFQLVYCLYSHISFSPTSRFSFKSSCPTLSSGLTRESHRLHNNLILWFGWTNVGTTENKGWRKEAGHNWQWTMMQTGPSVCRSCHRSMCPIRLLSLLTGHRLRVLVSNDPGRPGSGPVSRRTSLMGLWWQWT